jgi:hypothetical protein
MHECPRCDYETKFKYNLLKHFNRKNGCEIIKKDISIDECKELLKNGKLRIKETSEHACKYCSKKFDRKARLYAHNIKCKEKENLREELKEYKIKTELKLKESEQYSTQIDIKAKSLKELLMKYKREDKDEFVYLLKTREFINTGQEIYKIGKTVSPTNRMGNYPKGSKVKMMHLCDNCDKTERELIKLFDEKFIKQTDIGREYYKGDMREMIKEINYYFYDTYNKIRRSDVQNQ